MGSISSSLMGSSRIILPLLILHHLQINIQDYVPSSLLRIASPGKPARIDFRATPAISNRPEPIVHLEIELITLLSPRFSHPPHGSPNFPRSQIRFPSASSC